MTRIGVGIIGCGTISRAYVGAMKRFDGIELRAVADIRSGAAEALGAEAGVPALRVDQLLRRDDVEAEHALEHTLDVLARRLFLLLVRVGDLAQLLLDGLLELVHVLGLQLLDQ